MENIDDLKQVIHNAPEGATHYDNTVSYYKMDSHGREWGIWKGCWCVCVGANTMRMPPSMRSLEDAKQILRLEKKGEWVSVVDRLPEPYIDVLVFPINENMTYGSNYTAQYCTSKQEFEVDCEDSHACWQESVKVTHWMPLPQAPK